MRIVIAFALMMFVAGCSDVVVSPDPAPTQKMESDCGNELPENCEEEETHNEL